MSYLASPLWLMLILIGFALTLQATLIRPEYFSKTFQLFPDWPVFDARRMMLLFLFSMAVLLTPKVIGFVRGAAVAIGPAQLRRHPRPAGQRRLRTGCCPRCTRPS